MVSNGQYSLVACLASTISATVWKTPTKGHMHVACTGEMPHVETCEMALNSVKEYLLSFPNELHSPNNFLQTIDWKTETSAI